MRPADPKAHMLRFAEHVGFRHLFNFGSSKEARSSKKKTGDEAEALPFAMLAVVVQHH